MLRHIPKKLGGLLLILLGLYCGMIALFSEEPWADNVLVQYGGFFLAWAFVGAGVRLCNSKRSESSEENSEENASEHG